MTPFLPINYPPLTASPSPSVLTDAPPSPSSSSSSLSSPTVDVFQPSAPHSDVPSPLSSSFSQPSAPIPTKNSLRSHKPPSYLQDYHCHFVISSTCLPQAHHAFVSLLTHYTERQSYEAASQHPGWIEAMNREIQALMSNNTWEYVNLPPEKEAISSKWVYKVKLHSDGSLERLKAQLVIRGFIQRYGIDYQEVFSPVVKMATI